MANTTLLPDPQHLALEQIIPEADCITLVVRTKRCKIRCPCCKQWCSRVHSRYTRTLQDLPWGGIAVRLRLNTRRFFCRNENCERKIFTERLSTLGAPYGRKSKRLEEAFYLIGYVLGGEAGARLAVALGMTVSPDTLLRRVRKAASSTRQSPKVLGVDDWAWRKGQRYGTILVDLEQRCLADLLPDCTSNSFAAWLQTHPGVKVIGRDRSQVYREGAKLGAPQARQVADRWHLLKNFGDVLERLLTRQHRHLAEAAKRASSLPRESQRVCQTAAQQTEQTPSRAHRERALRRQRRLARYDQVMELYRCGAQIRQIAGTVSLDPKTVRKWIRAGGFPERATRRRGPSKLHPFVPYLRSHWQEGCHNAAQLWREITAEGYTGCYSMVKAYLAPWRVRLPAHQRDSTPGVKPNQCARSVIPSSRAAMWMLMREPDEDKPEKARFHRRFVRALRELCPQIQAAEQLAQQFQTLVKEQQVGRLDPWIAEVQKSQIPELKSFANGLVEDKEVVVGALSLEWSNGQAEGQIHRLKLIKRSMYGRANFDLLRARVLPAAA
jgi:transposase